MPATKPHVQLTGKDGNAFSILGSCSKAAKNRERITVLTC